MTDYVLKYCYRYEPGFNVYDLIDIVLYDSNGVITPEINRYLEKEESFIEEEDKHQLFFIVNHLTMAQNLSTITFLKIVLYPKETKDTNVVNVIFSPLIKQWDEYTMSEQDQIVKEAVWDQEKFVGLKYNVVEVEEVDVYVENAEDMLMGH